LVNEAHMNAKIISSLTSIHSAKAQLNEILLLNSQSIKLSQDMQMPPTRRASSCSRTETLAPNEECCTKRDE